jgi:hypothetical protein
MDSETRNKVREACEQAIFDALTTVYDTHGRGKVNDEEFDAEWDKICIEALKNQIDGYEVLIDTDTRTTLESPEDQHEAGPTLEAIRRSAWTKLAERVATQTIVEIGYMDFIVSDYGQGDPAENVFYLVDEVMKDNRDVFPFEIDSDEWDEAYNSIGNQAIKLIEEWGKRMEAGTKVEFRFDRED